jgi:ubiquinone/menaquinone biosynthesis C-methylase UbiE
MAGDLAFDAHRFQTAAAHYLQGRPPYAPVLMRRIVQICGLDGSQRLLDLGCGPGQIAFALACHVREVVGMDPEPAMLALARSRAGAPINVHFTEGSSYDLGPALGRFDLVTIGRAFHWMNRAETLKRLNPIIEAGGAVVLFSTDTPELPQNAWHRAYRDVTESYAMRDPDRVRRKSADWAKDEAVLLESSFNRLERITAIERHETAVEALVDRALSTSSMTRARLAGQADELAGALRAALAPFATEGRIAELVESEALIARRDTEAD